MYVAVITLLCCRLISRRLYCILEQDRTVKISNTLDLAENWATAGDVWCEQDSESGSPKSDEKEVFKGVK